MKKKKFLKTILIIGLAGILIAIGIVSYLFNMPQRDVQSAKTDYIVNAQELVTEYLNDNTAANKKYLASDGNSKILQITGTVHQIDTDLKGQTVIVLKNEGENAGVSCTFTLETSENTAGIEIGNEITVKGVIRSGASYDEDLELYENVNIEKCDLIN